MKVYDFSHYVKKRKENTAAMAVVEVAADANRPSSVIELKQKIFIWFKLHQEVLKKQA